MIIKEKKVNYKIIVNIIGYIIVALSFIFIINSFRKLDLNLLKDNINIFWIPLTTLLILIYSFTVFLYSVSWKYIIEIFSDVKLTTNFISSIYMRANVAKYIPGNIFHFAGRHLLVREKGVKDKDLVFSNILEILFLIFFSFLIILSGFIFGIINIPNIIKEKINIYYIIILIIIFILLVSGYFVYMKIQKKRINWKMLLSKKLAYNYFKLTFIYILIFILVGLILYTVTILVLNNNFSLNNMLFVICSFSLAWVLGYITPGAPGGLGIRETVIILMLSSRFTQNGALVSAIILRFITLSGDVFAFVIGSIIRKNNLKYDKEDTK